MSFASEPTETTPQSEAVQEALSSAKPVEPSQDALDRSLETRAHIKGLESFFELRSEWSLFLTLCIGFSLLGQFALAFMIGADLLNFKDYQVFLGAVVVENFLQIAGMGYIVVNFLFKEPTRRS
jgi:hypothetical protein